MIAYLGLGSRYSYLAATQLDHIAEETGANFEWCPIDSVTLIRRARPEGSPFDAPVLAGQYAAEFRHRDACNWAGYYGVPYNEPKIAALASNAMALTCWAQSDPSQRRDLMKAIYSAVFAEGTVMTLDRLAAIARDFGVCRPAMDAALTGGDAADKHEQAMTKALSAGVFGVPTFVCEDALFWGNDRLPLLKRHLLNMA